VQQPRPDRIELVVLEHGVVRSLLSVEDDVEDGVEAVVTGENSPKLALLDREEMGISARAVENTGDHAGCPEPPRHGATGLVARQDVQLDPLTSHSGGQV
jgi:hypothetical protein